jgi:hypothetical protein
VRGLQAPCHGPLPNRSGNALGNTQEQLHARDAALNKVQQQLHCCKSLGPAPAARRPPPPVLHDGRLRVASNGPDSDGDLQDVEVGLQPPPRSASSLPGLEQEGGGDCARATSAQHSPCALPQPAGAAIDLLPEFQEIVTLLAVK